MAIEKGLVTGVSLAALANANTGNSGTGSGSFNGMGGGGSQSQSPTGSRDFSASLNVPSLVPSGAAGGRENHSHTY